MRLVRLNWVAKGQTITDESSVRTRVSGVHELEAISLFEIVSFKKYASLFGVRHSLGILYMRGDIAALTFLCIFSLSLYRFSLSLFSHLSISLIYRKI